MTRSIKTDRKLTAVNKHWSAKDRVRAVAAYLVTGNMSVVADETGIPLGTLNYWKGLPWWYEQVEKARQAEDQELDSQFSRIVKKTQEIIMDRLENGDTVVHDGKLIKKPVSMRDTGIVMGISMERRKELRENPTNEGRIGMQDRLKKLEEQFTRMVTSKIIDGEVEVLDAQQIQEASTDDGSSSPQPEVRQEDGDSPKGSEGVQPS